MNKSFSDFKYLDYKKLRKFSSKYNKGNIFKRIYDDWGIEHKITFIFICILIFIVVFRLDSSLFNVDRMGDIRNIYLYIFAALVGLLGIVIAVFSIITTSINGNVIANIENNDKVEDTIEIFSSFYQICISNTYNLVLIILHLILLSSSIVETILYKISFYLLLSISIYILSYSASLIGTCISLFFINKIYEKSKSELLKQSKIKDIVYVKMNLDIPVLFSELNSDYIEKIAKIYFLENSKIILEGKIFGEDRIGYQELNEQIDIVDRNIVKDSSNRTLKNIRKKLENIKSMDV